MAMCTYKCTHKTRSLSCALLKCFPNHTQTRGTLQKPCHKYTHTDTQIRHRLHRTPAPSAFVTSCRVVTELSAGGRLLGGGTFLLGIIFTAISQCSLTGKGDCPPGLARLRCFCCRFGQKYTCIDPVISGKQIFHLLLSKSSQNQCAHPQRFSFSELTHCDRAKLPIPQLTLKCSITSVYLSQHWYFISHTQSFSR